MGMANDEKALVDSDLYTLPLDQFTAARDELAQRLRSEGDAEGAKRVGKLRKPSVAAWALNRAARYNPELVSRLLDSHQRLRQAASRQEVEEASETRRQAVAILTDAAMTELDKGSLQTRDRINRTLLAVATDAQGETDLAAGTLVRELEPSGGGWGEMELPPVPEPDPAEQTVLVAEQARELARKLEAEAEDTESQVEAAKEALAEARRRAKQARAAADKATAEARQAEKEIEG
jgi:predicted ribosome quality control (RQC) complex YloA/Tae2 family protein